MNANTTISTNTIRLATAMRWRKKRRVIRDHWPRSLVVMASASSEAAGVRLLIADPRVEHAVQQVGDQDADEHDDTGK
ncbi:hypothetical protein GCM10029992_21940 [Glycomyces albus]